MEDEPKSYTNRELGMLIKSNADTNQLQHEKIILSLNDFHKQTKETLELLLVQTTKTNGSVRELQLWKANFEGKTYAVPIIVSAIIAGAVGLLFKLF